MTIQWCVWNIPDHSHENDLALFPSNFFVPSCIFFLSFVVIFPLNLTLLCCKTCSQTQNDKMEKWVGHTLYFAPNQEATLPIPLPTQPSLFPAQTAKVSHP